MMILIIATTAIFFYLKDMKTYDIQCRSYVSYRSEPIDFYFNAMISMDIRHSARGEFSVEGMMKKNGQTWTLNRDVKFTYHKLQNNAFQMDNIRVFKAQRDNAPDDIFAVYVMPLTQDASRTVTLSRAFNGYVVGNLRAPAFTCIPD